MKSGEILRNLADDAVCHVDRGGKKSKNKIKENEGLLSFNQKKNPPNK